MKKFAVAAFLLILSLTLLMSCGGGASDQTILSALEELAPKAHTLYGIIYGDTLPHGEALDDGYCQVSASAPMKSISELRASMETVFSPDYVKILSNTAFSGVSSDEGMISAKFTERGGVLFVNPKVTEDFGEPRTFDLSKAKVLKKNPYMAIVLLPHADGDLEVTLRNVGGAWLIDSPIF